MCEAMRWGVLPVAGGLYDQHPQLLEEWDVIFTAKAKKAERDRQEQKRKSDAAGRSRGRGRGR